MSTCWSASRISNGSAWVLEGLGFLREDRRGFELFLDPQEPSRRSGVRLIWAEELVRPSYVCPAPSVDEAVRDPAGFRVLDLPALMRMKLTSFRDIDRVHLADILKVGLIDDPIRRGLPDVLTQRLSLIEQSLEQ